MSYYTDLDGAYEEAARDLRIIELEKGPASTTRKRATSKPLTAKPNKQNKPVRGTKTKVKCKHCDNEFMARNTDLARGWGKFCSKSCKARFKQQ